MKKIIYLMIITLAAGYFSSCKDMDETYKEFVVANGLTYPQKPDSLKVQAGYNTLRLTWLKSKDPSVVRAEIYWNNYLDTLKVNNISADRDTIVADIPDLDEITYTFYVKTFDADGNASIPVEVSGTPYGEIYIMKTADRTVASALFDNDGSGNGIITWGAKTTDLVYSEVRYTTNADQTRIVRVLPGEVTSTCQDAKPGALFEYRSVFLPPGGIQSVEKEWVTYESSFIFKFSRTGWTAESRNGNHSWGANDGRPSAIFDGNLTTGWHSTVSPAAPLPQCLVIDMKRIYSIHHLILYPFSSYDYIRNMEVYLSDTPITPDIPQPSWGAPVASLQLTGGGSAKTIEFPSVLTGQYVVLVFLTSSSSTYINLMEFEVYGY